MKSSIEKHKQRLQSREAYYQREKTKVDNLVKRLEKMAQENALYAAQIELAIKEKKDGFDEEKYAIKRIGI